MKLSEEIRGQARALIADRLGLDFGERRQADLERGLARASRNSPASTPEAYLAWLASLLQEDPEWAHLAGHLTVGETYFFRDRACFEALEHEVLPALIAARRSEGPLRLRLWSAGCATGEEPYSLAILLDRLLPDLADWSVTLLATDINPDALARAERGVYREWALRETPPWIRERYLHRRGPETFELAPRIRRSVTFAPLNLARESYPSVVTNTSAMDLIVCRNVLMYFTPEAQRAAAARLQRALVTGGWLVVSPAETSTDLFRPLVPVNFPGAILYRNDPTPVTPPLPPWAPETLLLEPPAPVPVVDAPGEPVLREPPSPWEEQAEEGPVVAATDLQRARALADRGDLEEAGQVCEAVLATDRLDPEAHILLAAICQERGEIPRALEALRRAIYLAPDSASAHFLLGTLLLRHGERRRARRCLETVVAILSPFPPDEPVPGGDGLTVGRLLETTRAYLEAQA